MAYLLLKTRLAWELPRINAALERAEKTLPLSVQPIAHHIFAAGGKRLRPLLTILSARLFGYKQDDVYDLAITLEMLHAATLLHDDVIDDAPLRRGKAAAHTIFSLTETILAGDALLAAGNALVAAFDHPALSRCFSNATTDTCAGEIYELQYQHNPKLELGNYLDVIKGKTARLISCACEMGARLAGADEENVTACAAFGENIGIAFQLVDDAIDFAPQSVTGKPSGGDLKEGKLTLPLRYYRETLTPDEQDRFDQDFSAENFSEEEYHAITQAITEHGFDQKTRTFADTYLARAVQSLKGLPDSSEKNLLTEMTAYVRERTK